MAQWSSDDGGLSRYIERVRSIPLLEREEEHAVAVRAAAGDEKARELLVRSNLRFVVAMAVRHRRKGVRLAELVAEGNVGLVIASTKFDPTRGTRFVSYAGFWIRAYILGHVVRAAAVVGAGSGPMRSKLFFRLRRERALLQEAGITGEEQWRILAAKLDTTPAKVEQMLRHLDLRAISFDVPIGGEGTSTLIDVMEGDLPDAETALLDAQASATSHRRLHDALATLDPRERFILEQRFMQDDEPSLADIGRRLGVSRERARQIEVRARGKLRERLSDLAQARAA